MKDWYPIYLGMIAVIWFLLYPIVVGRMPFDTATFLIGEVFGFGASWAAIHIAMKIKR